MKKIRKLFACILTLSFAGAIAFGCAKKSGVNTDNSSSSLNSSLVESSETISESAENSSDVVEESSEIVENSSDLTEDSSQESEDNSESVHTCIMDGEWITNKNGHWLKCDCGKFAQYGSHSGKATECGEQPICDICGAVFGKPLEHSYGALSDGDAGKAYYCNCGEYLTNEDLVDFVLEVESGDPVVLQLSDTQICNWGDVETWCYRYVREVVEKTDPDLIILTGDIVYGRFDPNGALLKGLINFMETLNTPWAPVFGNHDNESLMGVDWQCQQLEAAENCLFKQGDLTGNGNYSVGITQGGELLRVFYMLDSNGCSEPMVDSTGKPGGHSVPGTNVVQTSAGLATDQVTWFIDSINAIHAVTADVKISMAYHIQPTIFHDAFKKYKEYDGLIETGSSSILKNPLNLDTLETADDTDFGYLGRTTKGPWGDSRLSISKLKELSVDSIFVGHEHCNSVSIVYEGIRFQYGQKSSEYDRYNTLTQDREIFGDYHDNHPAGAIPLMGGTVIPISAEDGSIGTGYICYYGDPFAENAA